MYNLCTEFHADFRHLSILQMGILRSKRTKPIQPLSSAPESCSQVLPECFRDLWAESHRGGSWVGLVWSRVEGAPTGSILGKGLLLGPAE